MHSSGNNTSTSLCPPDGDLKVTLPTPPDVCTLSPANVEDDTVKFLILETNSSTQQSLTSGSIGKWAYPNSPFYYTYGPDPARVHICNDLPDTMLFAAVSGQGSNTQWPVSPGVNEYWNRNADALVHISTPITVAGEQSAQVYEGRVGRTLHIQKLDLQVRWSGAYSFSLWMSKECTSRGASMHLLNVLQVLPSFQPRRAHTKILQNSPRERSV